MKLFEELKRRNVIKATMAYIVVSWVLIQVLTIILPVFQAPDWVLKTLMILLAIGLPIWMTFSWVYEVTPEGIKKTADISTDDSITAVTNKRLNIIILIVLIIAIGVNFIGTDKPDNTEVSFSTEAARNNSIAVLPFLDMSPSKDQEFYSDGIAIEILNALCKFKGLRVVGRTSSFSFKDSNQDITSIGNKLNVINILEGSVQKQEDLILISVRLLNAKDGYTIFSETYSDSLENIFDLQSTIALDIAEKIESKLELGDNMLHPRKKINPLSYELYLKGKNQFEGGPLSMKEEEVYKAKKYFESALKVDPNFGEASAYLSLAYFNLSDWALDGGDIIKMKVAIDSAKLLAKRAHDIDSLSSGAHLAMGSYYFHEYNWQQAEIEKRRAVALNPGGVEEKLYLSSFLAQFGQDEEALQLGKQALKLDPLDDKTQIKYIRDLYFTGHYDEAITRCQHLIEQNRKLTGAYQFLFMCYADLKQYEQAGSAFGKLMELHRQQEISELFKENDFQSAIKKLFVLHEQSKLPIFSRASHKAVFSAYLEDRENTINYLYETFYNQDPQLSFFLGARFDFVRDDPRCIKLYEMAGFKAYDEYKKNNLALMKQ